MDPQLLDLGHFIKRLQHRHHRAADIGLMRIGTTLVQWDVLRAIKHCPEASAHQLAVHTFQTDQSFGALASRMIASGVIQRTQGPGRAFRHTLTALGADIFEKGIEVMDAVLSQSFAPLTSSERLTLHKTLVHLLGHTEEKTEK